MLCKNISNSTVRFSISGLPGQPPQRYEVRPGEKVDISDGYCDEYINSSGRRSKPIIQQICPAMKPTGEYPAGTVPPPRRRAGTTSEQLQQLIEQQALLNRTVQNLSAKLDQQERENRQLAADLEAARRTYPADTPSVEADGEQPSRDEAKARLMAHRKAELLDMCRDAGLTGYTQLSKPQLAEALLGAYFQDGPGEQADQPEAETAPPQEADR